MDSSLIVARSGMPDEGTGLFVLEGQREQFMLADKTVDIVGRSTSGYEVQSAAVFHQNSNWEPVFINKAEGYSDLVTTNIFLHNLNKQGGLGSIDGKDHGLYGQTHIAKVAAKRYITEWTGLAPPTRAIRLILRQMNVATKRTILLALGVPPHKGGRTWAFCPTGFNWCDTDERYVVAPGDVSDFAKIGLDSKNLYLLATNAVPFVSGHRERARDEAHPRILHFNLDGLPAGAYESAVEAYFELLADGAPAQGAPLSWGATIIEGLVAKVFLSGSKGGIAGLQFGLEDVISFDGEDEDVFC